MAFRTITTKAVKMKKVLLLIFLLNLDSFQAQLNFPAFLEGTWKTENKESYEHWDKLNDRLFRGFSYELKNGMMEVTEYVELAVQKNKVTYTANVIKQNNGNGVSFIMTKSDSIFVFENPNHDFPKKISYKKLNDIEVFVHVSDGNQRGFSYKIIKQNTTKLINDTNISNPNYDPILASKLNADEFGMKSYVFVLLKTGKNETTDRLLIEESFRGHMENINLLVEQEKLIVAGPFGKNQMNYRGLFIFNLKSIEETEQYLQNDPAISAGLLTYEICNWYGSAAIAVYLASADKIWKNKP